MTSVDLGRDLRVILDAAGFGAYDSEALDLRTRSRPPHGTAATSGQPHGKAGAQGWAAEPADADRISDLDVIAGREAVAQALVLRLLTPRGSLAALGHATYGSRLGELIGENKTDALRGLCRAYILEAIREEPRVEQKPLSITFDIEREPLTAFAVQIVVQPVSGGDPLALGLEVTL
jgi:phage baseplate assembly protein W